MITGFVQGQVLRLSAPVVAADTLDYLTAQFVFRSADWIGMDKWAHFAKGGTVYDVRLTEDKIQREDHLNLGAGEWKVYIHGNRFADGTVVERITTAEDVLRVVPTGALDGEPFPEIPASVTEQILARLENVEQNGGGGGGGISGETDPTVPDWAKQPKKPTYTAKEVGAATEEQFNQLSEAIANMQVGNKTAFDTFIDNVDVDYAYDETTGAYYTVIRIYRDRVDGKKQYPFVYAPNGYGAGDKTTYDISTAEGWCLAINSGIFDMTTKKPDGILIQNGVVLKNSPSATHLLCKPLTIDSNGNLGYVAYDADAEQLAKSGIVSAVCGFMPIVVNYEAVPDTEWNSVGHYTDNAQRQIIGQWGCGDYAIITCEGRGKHNSDGWTIAEAQAICIKHGLKFAYNLDGGGSTETMLGLKHINTIYEGTTGRIVPTFIVFNGTDDLGIIVEPDEGVSYTPLEYVQFTGKQYIMTDVPESTTFGAEAELSFDSLTNTTGMHFLSAPNSYIISTTMDYPLVKRCGGWETTPYVKDNPDTSLRLAVDTVYTVSAFVDGNTYKWGNYEIQKYANDTVSGNYVIGCWAGALNTRCLKCRLYSLKFYDSGVLTHNFVPSMRNDGAVGLLETVENKFYESATSTALVAGSAVS